MASLTLERVPIMGFAAATAVVVGLLSWAAVTASAASDSVALWWPAAGVSVAAVIMSRASARPWIVLIVFVASVAGNAIGGRPLLVSVLFGLSNAGEAAAAGWWLLRGVDGRPSLSTLPDLWRLLQATLMGATVIATGATLTVVAVGGGSAWPTFLHVMASHASAVLLIVPFALRQPRQPTTAGRSETAAQVAVTMAMTVAIFGFDTWLSLPFLILAPQIWGALRLGLRLMTVEVAVSLIVALTLTAFGLGPFSAAAEGIGTGVSAEGTSSRDFIVMQIFVASTFVFVLALAIAASQQRTTVAHLTRSERLLRGGIQDSLLGTAILRQRDGQLEVVEVNQVASDLLSLDSNRSAARHDQFGGQPAVIVALLNEVADGRRSGWRDEIELPSSHGPSRWAEVAISAISDEQGLIVMQLVDTTARKTLEAELEHLAIHDTTTGLPNRTLLRDRLERSISAAERTGAPVTVVFLDLDDFKEINDTAGHAVGDEILQEVANRLTAVMRRSDTVARLGGDEFVILLPAASPATVNSFLARVRRALDEPFTTSSGTYRVTASLGVTPSTLESTVDQLLRDADTAMYVSKGNGRGLVTWFDPSFRERALHAAALTSQFHGAVDRGEVVLFVQPIIELTSGRIAAAEVLVRWRHPAHGLLAPGHWLDVVNAGATGQGLEEWILAEACRVLAQWSARWRDDCPALHVNVSTAFVSHCDLASAVESALGLAGAPTTRLVVELTESGVETERESLSGELERLRDMGVQISVDDFGTGYSALSRLAHLPLDELKIDQSFVAQVLTDERSREIVGAVVGLSGALNLTTVAEGIETVEQADYLRKLGCHRGQGFLWGRPGPIDDFVIMVDRALEAGGSGVRQY